jgi:hypothetical protein
VKAPCLLRRAAREARSKSRLVRDDPEQLRGSGMLQHQQPHDVGVQRSRLGRDRA